MAKKSNMGVVLGIGAVAAAAGLGYYLYNRSKESDGVSGIFGASRHRHAPPTAVRNYCEGVRLQCPPGTIRHSDNLHHRCYCMGVID